MTRFGLIAIALVAALLATGADANPKGHKGNAWNCPPGLAKKDPPCVPPGQARKSAPSDEREKADSAEVDAFTPYRPGDTLLDDYVVLIDPYNYRPDHDALFVRYGNYLYRIDRDTGIVLDQLGPVADWTWNWADTDFANCPPGLAKKNPPCVPPGLADKGVTGRVIGQDTPFDPYGIGDRLPEGYVVFLDPRHFAPTPDPLYVRYGDTVYLIDRATGLIREIIGILNLLFR